MTTNLFQNDVWVAVTPATVRAALVNVPQLVVWNPEIGQVTATPTGFTLTRTTAALNRTETVTIHSAPNRVSYQSRGDRLDYRLVFDLVPRDGGTTLRETFTPETAAPWLTWLAPVAKRAFQRNLQQLARLLTLAAAQ